VNWAVSAVCLDEERFAALVSAAETAVSFVSSDITEVKAEESDTESNPVPESSTATAEATPLAVKTPAPAPTPIEDMAYSGLAFSEFLDQSYTQLGLRYPEYMTELGVADALGIGNDKLNNHSDAYIRETQQLERDIFDVLLTYNRNDLDPTEKRTYDLYKWYLEDLIAAQAFMYNDYPVSQFIFSVHSGTEHFFTEIHPVTSYKDAEDYIVRLSQVDDKFLAVLDGLKIRTERGVILPKFLMQWTLHDLSAWAKAEARDTSYFQVFEQKVNALDALTDTDKQALLDDAESMINEAVIPAYQALADYYTELLSAATNDAGVWKFADGEAYYAYMLKHFTTTDLTADEIHTMGLQEVERIENEMRGIFKELGYPENASIPELYERVAEDSGYLTGSDILKGYEALIKEADARVRESFNLLPSSECVVIEDEYGGYYVAPALDGSRPGAFYARASGSEPKFAMATLAYHEAVPGHHFQIAIAQELDLPAFRREGHFTAYSEGWALYAEYLAWELGLYDDDPYGNLGRLQAEMFRAVRLVVDTAIHTKGWTFDQAVNYMVEHTGQDERMVQYQIARYIVWPAQAVSYKIGMMKIIELRQRAMDALGNGFDIREFHNVILGEGNVPLIILEQIVEEYIAAAG
jgi:uncharacterized protein (DUF885 family)